MKKILLTLLLALPFCMVAKAQDFRVGITGGYNLSSPSGYKSQSGFHVGVKGELGLPIVTKGLYMDFGLKLAFCKNIFISTFHTKNFYSAVFQWNANAIQ